MRTGLFEHWQAEYAERGVPTFPVREDKVPAVAGYLKVGRKASEQLALRFPDALGIGFACKRNGVTVLDVDTTDETVLVDGLARYGETPFIVRSGSGHFQAWYRNNGEGRRVRPNPSVPIDILGDGFVVAPPSQAQNGTYRIIQGTLDDLTNLPKMLAADRSTPSMRPKTGERRSSIVEGNGRNDDLFRQCMKMARSCRSMEELMERGMEYNRGFPEPMPTEEVLKVIASAWGYEVEGKNWFGHGGRVIMAHTIVDDLAAIEPRAFALLSLLMRHHWGRPFYLTKSYAKSIGWAVNTLRDARDVLVRLKLIECIHEGGKRPNDPPVYQFGKGVKN